MLITNCTLDPSKLGVLAECLDGDPQEGEWAGQLLSMHSVAYSCGILARKQDTVVHSHDSEELKRCQTLATAAAQVMQGVSIGGSDEGDHTLDPFFIPANSGDPAPGKIDEKFFRSALRGTLHPKAKIVVEPLAKSSAWWKAVSTVTPDLANDPDEKKRVAPWGQLLDWFGQQKELRTPVYIGLEESDDAPATVHPRFFVGLTAAGSLVGLVTCVVGT